MIVVYHFWSSVCSVKVRMCLEEKGLEWQSRFDLFRFNQLRPEYLAINPDAVKAVFQVHGVDGGGYPNVAMLRLLDSLPWASQSEW
jgi:glutathione S-transferase